MPQFKLGDTVECLRDIRASDEGYAYKGNRFRVGHTTFALVAEDYIFSSPPTQSPPSSWVLNGINQSDFKLVDPTPPITSPSSPMSILDTIRNATLGAAERKLRKAGLKDNCGLWTVDARTAFVESLMNEEENTTKMVAIADDLIAEQEKAKK